MIRENWKSPKVKCHMGKRVVRKRKESRWEDFAFLPSDEGNSFTVGLQTISVTLWHWAEEQKRRWAFSDFLTFQWIYATSPKIVESLRDTHGPIWYDKGKTLQQTKDIRNKVNHCFYRPTHWNCLLGHARREKEKMTSWSTDIPDGMSRRWNSVISPL